MNEFLKGIMGSFNNSPDGSSGKKITAMFFTIFAFIIPVIVWTYWAFNHNDFSLLTTVLTISSSAILLLFGINEIAKKNNNEPKDENDA